MKSGGLCAIIVMFAAVASTSAPAAPSLAGGKSAGNVVVVWAFGDACAAKSTAKCHRVAQLIAADPSTDAVLVLGDAQYDNGTLHEYRRFWHVDMAPIDPLVLPAPGNHDYKTADAAGYFGYFGAKAGTPGKGWYSKTLGGWKIIATNSNCFYVGGCDPRSAQAKFLRSQISRSPQMCQLVFDHHPAFSDGSYAPGTRQGQMLFRDAYASHADLFLSGHDHNYQRFGPKAPDGTRDPHGVHSLVVGTGGKHLDPLGTTNRSQYRQDTTYGALRLALSPTSYSGKFIAVGGKVMDRFHHSCH
jgi:Calcineurin-like phosphoesterase